MNRELVAAAVFFVSILVGKINGFFLGVSVVVSFFAVLYFCGALVERLVMKTHTWFRATPGESQFTNLEELPAEDLPVEEDERIE